MFFVWKLWGLCEISEAHQYWDDDQLGPIDFAVNWVRVPIYAMSKMYILIVSCNKNPRSTENTVVFFLYANVSSEPKSERWTSLWKYTHQDLFL